MALLDRIFHDGINKNIPRFKNHQFVANLHLWAIGTPGWNKTSVMAALDLDITDESQLDELVLYFQSLDAAGKRVFRDELESATALAEGKRDGTVIITRTWFANRFSLTEEA